MLTAVSLDSANTTKEAGKAYLAPLRLSGQKKVWNKKTQMWLNFHLSKVIR